MKKTTHFRDYRGSGWPEQSWLAPYFLTFAGRHKAFGESNDSWGLGAEGVNSTSDATQVDVDLTILGRPDLGVLLFYDRMSASDGRAYYSKGDLNKLNMWVKTAHGDRMPVGLFIPFEAAWAAVQEFMESDGALPKCISWVSADELPAGTFLHPSELYPDEKR